MELTLTEAARVAGLTTRWLQHAAAAGDLPLHRVIGKTETVEGTIFRAWTRTQARGRRWEDATRLAAISLLDGGGGGSLGPTRRSQLRASLNTLDSGGIAHRLGAARGWFRYRSATCSRTDLATAVMVTGASGITAALSEALGMTDSKDVLYGRTTDLDRIESEFGLVLDDEGDIFLAGSAQTGVGEFAVLVDLYLFGDARGSHAAAMEIERRAREC